MIELFDAAIFQFVAGVFTTSLILKFQRTVFTLSQELLRYIQISIIELRLVLTLFCQYSSLMLRVPRRTGARKDWSGKTRRSSGINDTRARALHW
jgi:hypothetical protein